MLCNKKTNKQTRNILAIRWLQVWKFMSVICSNYRFYYKTVLSLLPFGLLGFCWLVLSMEFWVLACLFLSVKNTLVPWSQISAISFTGHNYMKGSGRFPLFACDSPTARVSTGVSGLMQDVSLGTLGSDALQARAYCDPALRQQTRGSGGNKVLASSQQPHTQAHLAARTAPTWKGCNPYTHPELGKSMPVDYLTTRLVHKGCRLAIPWDGGKKDICPALAPAVSATVLCTMFILF